MQDTALGREVIGRGQYYAIKKYTVAWQARHSIRDERLQVENNIFLFKKNTVARHAKNSLWQGKQDSASGMRSYKFKIVVCHYKNSLWQGRQDSVSGMRSYILRTVVYCNKKHTVARQAIHCVQDERFQVENNILL